MIRGLGQNGLHVKDMHTLHGSQGCKTIFRLIEVQKIKTFLKSPLASTSNTVGFIGLGNMGKGMAENLVTKVELLEQTSFPLLILRHNIFI